MVIHVYPVTVGPNHDRKMTLPHLHRDYDREKVTRVKHSEETKRFIQQRLTQREGKQLQHIYGSTEYNKRVTISAQPPSYFTISTDKIDSIVKTHVNINKLGDRYQFVDAGKPIGHYIQWWQD